MGGIVGAWRTRRAGQERATPPLLLFHSHSMSTSAQHPMINVAVKAARAAGALINRAAMDVGSLKVTQKATNDYVTEVDQASERTIIDILLSAYPDHAIWAEESGRSSDAAHAEFVWIIDPLDGTTNFIHGLPTYCVSIALAHRGRVEQAVIYDPTRNDLFTATRGRGAYMNNRRMRVAQRTQLRDCLIATGFPFRDSDDFDTYLQMMGQMMQRTAGLRRPGSAALDLAYVAAGFTDGFFETGLSPWDVAAGSLLVTEAGGLIGNLSGAPDFLEQRECLAANPRIYGQLVGVLGAYSKFASAEDKSRVATRRPRASSGAVQISRPAASPAPAATPASSAAASAASAAGESAPEAAAPGPEASPF